MALLVRNGKVYTEAGIRMVDILIEEEVITRIESGIEVDADTEILDATNCLILPGIIDCHVHFNMKTLNGRTADNFETGSKSAAFGGVTTFIDYASPVEGLTMLESLRLRMEEVECHSFIDYSFHMEVTGEFPQDLDQLKDIRESGINSFKIYTTYGNTELPEDQVTELLIRAKSLGMMVTVHAEEDSIISEIKKSFVQDGKTAPKFHGESRPASAEVEAVKRLIGMAENAGTPIYFVHISTGDAAELIAEARFKGLEIYGETCPHYLLLTDSSYMGNEAQKYIMSPPLRNQGNQDTLWKAIAEGVLQCISTDHCAFTLGDKLSSESCFETIPGIGGVETSLSLIFTYGVLEERLTLEGLVNLMSTNAAKLFGLYPKKGTISAGSDGDLIIFDPNEEDVIKGKNLHSASAYSVFEGWKVKGKTKATVLRGRVICANGELLSTTPRGQFVKG